MANEGDMAQAVIEREEAIRQQKIEAIRNTPKKREEFCIDCDELIPEARHEATGGAERCTLCEGIFSDRSKINMWGGS